MGKRTASEHETRVKLHPKQGRAYRSTKRIVLCCSGIQGGKSLVGALKLRWAVDIGWPAKKYPNISFAVCAPDHKSMVQSTRQSFDPVFRGKGVMREMDQVYQLYDGRKIFFRTMVKNPWAVEGIPNCVFIWGDEAGQYPRLAYVNMVGRTAFMADYGSQVFFTTTPYANNWVKREVIDRQGKDPDIDYYEWLSIENPAFPKDEYEKQKGRLSRREFERKYMGMHNRMEGLIFEDFDDGNLVDGSKLDLEGFAFYGGIDWGFDHPMALSIRAVGPEKAYGVSFFKGSGLSVTQQIDLIQSKTRQYGVKLWFAGHDRPDLILELNNRKTPVVKYFEGNDDYREINAGNQKLSEMIKTKEYQVFEQAPGLADLQDEYETYHWDVKEGDEEPEGKLKPKDVNNDLISAERYCTVGTMHKLRRKAEKEILPANYWRSHDKWRPGKATSKSWDAY